MASGPIDVAAVKNALSGLKDPESGRSLTKLDQVKDVQIENGKLSLELSLTTWAAPLWRDICDAAEEKLRAFAAWRARQHVLHSGQHGLSIAA